MEASNDFFEINPTALDFAASGYDRIIASASERDCAAYTGILSSPPDEIRPPIDSPAWSVLRLLGAATSLRLKADSPAEPMVPLAVFPEFRTATLQDFTDVQLDLFEQVAPGVEDPELRARLADIVWIRRRRFQLAELAVRAYLASASDLEDPKDWPDFVERVERALRIAMQLGRVNPLQGVVVAAIEDALTKYDGEDPLFLSARLMELLLEHRRGDPTRYADLAKKAAERAETDRDWHRARTYWHIWEQWCALARDIDSQRDAGLRIAATCRKEAEEALSQAHPSYFAASHHLEMAVQALRRVPDTEQQRAALHKQLLDYQERSLMEFKANTINLDLSRFIEQAKELVRGKSLIAALVALGRCRTSPSLSELRQSVEESVKKFPMQNLMPTKHLSKAGKVVGRRGSALSDDAEVRDRAMHGLMLQNITQMQNIFALSCIVPAIEQIDAEHSITATDLLPLLLDNPFVPPGRELIYARGLQAGLAGDHLVSAHLLIPQIEDSLRHILNARGVVTSTHDDFGVQDEFDLNRILDMPKLTQVLGSDLIFELQALMTEHLGANLRNRLAHGLIGYDDFHSTQVVFLWWMALHFLCVPIARVPEERPPSAESESSADNSHCAAGAEESGGDGSYSVNASLPLNRNTLSGPCVSAQTPDPLG